MYILNVALDVPLYQTFSYLCESKLGIGTRVAVPFGLRGKRVVGFVMQNDVDASTLGFATDKLKTIVSVFDEVLHPEIIKLIEFTSNYYCHPIGQTVFSAIPANFKLPKIIPQTVKLSQLSAFALVNPAEKSVYNNEHHAATDKGNRLGVQTATPVKKITLTAEQQLVFEGISLHLGSYHPCVLYGITGSGKTEIYLELIAEIIHRGQQALVLVPEINLTPQLLARFKKRFKGINICTLTSHTSKGARVTDYLKAELAEAQIIIGTRLAVFTPFKNLGIIIVDEEHDSSFKQNDGLHYHARDLAVLRAKFNQIPIILGSATPALETVHNYKTQKYTLYTLQNRAVAAAQLPKIRLIDLNQQKPVDGLTAMALAAIEKRLQAHELSLVFINRRGYAPTISCYDCAWVSQCKNCSTNMVFHIKAQELKCHHCGSHQKAPHSCPLCGSQHLHALGVGSQKVEEALYKSFPEARICRIDQDTMSSKKAWQELYDKINRHEVDILVGTQMLSKGHDFHDITLVVGINIDSSLYSYDFRATELLFTQLTQVSGRAGRGAKAGEVLLQTNFPQHQLFKFLIKHDCAGFADYTLQERKQLALPPYTYYVMLRSSGKSMLRVIEYLSHIVGVAQTFKPAEISMYPPVPAVMQRLKNRERAQVLIYGQNREELHRFLARLSMLMSDIKPKFGITYSLDIDPLEL